MSWGEADALRVRVCGFLLAGVIMMVSVETFCSAEEGDEEDEDKDPPTGSPVKHYRKAISRGTPPCLCIPLRFTAIVSSCFYFFSLQYPFTSHRSTGFSVISLRRLHAPYGSISYPFVDAVIL